MAVSAASFRSATQARDPWFGSFLCAFSGWALDGFDFFLVVFSLTAIGHSFSKDDKTVALALTATLAFRPIGAFIFGLIADRYGRRLPLAINLLAFAVVEVFTGLAHTFGQFILIRAVFGIVMGGQWGVGASLAMEKVPIRLRGVLSGLLQEGYAIGYLLAAAAYSFLYDRFSWRPLFFLGPIPALAAAFFVAFNVSESAVWKRTHQKNWRGLWRALAQHWRLFAYVTLFMMTMHMTSHGTQDLYPTFLERQWRIPAKERAFLSALSMVGGIVGALSVSALSDKLGRRRSIVLALVGGLCVIPMWAFSHSLPLLILGAILIQFCVQGAWGVLPAHLSELSPDSIRGSLPGLGNQFGVLLASAVVYLEAAFVRNGRYSDALAGTAALVFALAVLMTTLGNERRGAVFGEVP
ncbi:MAG TPA: MFS transporter [Terracidiphilus sp.]|nr:MFS transporter [Terracidiphilus sp.]